MKSLFEITEEMKSLEAAITQAEEIDISEQELAALSAWLEGLSEEHEAKLDAYASVIRKLTHEAEYAAREAFRWEEKQRSRKRRVELLKARMMEHMTAIKRPKLSTKNNTFSIQQNGGVAPLVVEDRALIPLQYFKSNPVLDVDKVGNDLNAGKEIPGVKLGARGKHLRIR